MSSSDKAMISLFGVELTATVIGNTFLIVLLYKSKLLPRSASQNFILNCSVSDLVSSLVTIPFAMDYLVLKTGNLNGTVAPVVINFMITFLMMLTLHSTLIMMGDRFFIIKYPVKYNNMMKVKRGRLAIVAMWCSTFLLTLILTVLRLTRNPPLPGESPLEYMGRQFLTSGGKFFVFLMVALIYVVLASLTGMLYKALGKLLKTSQDETTNNRQDSRRKMAERKRITSSSRTVLFIMITYVICYLPTLINAFLRIIDSPLITTLSETTRAFVSLCCAQVSSAINPIVFIVRSSVLRQSAMKFFNLNRSNHVGVEMTSFRDRSSVHDQSKFSVNNGSSKIAFT